MKQNPFLEYGMRGHDPYTDPVDDERRERKREAWEDRRFEQGKMEAKSDWLEKKRVLGEK